jgi:hypothetical protein
MSHERTPSNIGDIKQKELYEQKTKQNLILNIVGLMNRGMNVLLKEYYPDLKDKVQLTDMANFNKPTVIDPQLIEPLFIQIKSLVHHRETSPGLLIQFKEKIQPELDRIRKFFEVNPVPKEYINQFNALFFMQQNLANGTEITKAEFDKIAGEKAADIVEADAEAKAPITKKSPPPLPADFAKKAVSSPPPPPPKIVIKDDIAESKDEFKDVFETPQVSLQIKFSEVDYPATINNLEKSYNKAHSSFFSSKGEHHNEILQLKGIAQSLEKFYGIQASLKGLGLIDTALTASELNELKVKEKEFENFLVKHFHIGSALYSIKNKDSLLKEALIKRIKMQRGIILKPDEFQKEMADDKKFIEALRKLPKEDIDPGKHMASFVKELNKSSGHTFYHFIGDILKSVGYDNKRKNLKELNPLEEGKMIVKKTAGPAAKL